MVVVAQLVRALDCGSRGRRFEPGLPPFISEKSRNLIVPGFFVFGSNQCEKSVPVTSTVKVSQIFHSDIDRSQAIRFGIFVFDFQSINSNPTSINSKGAFVN